MAMHKFPHHPHNHPNSPNDSSPTAPHYLPTKRTLHEARKTALLTLIPKLLEAQTLIAQSKARPPLSDDERISALPSPSRVPKMAPRRRRPRRLELRDECADATSSAGRQRGAEMPPQPVLKRREVQIRGGQSVTDVDANTDLEAQAQAQAAPMAKNRFLKLWHSMSWREKAMLDIMLLICITTACVLPFVVIYARRAGYH